MMSQVDSFETIDQLETIREEKTNKQLALSNSPTPVQRSKRPINNRLPDVTFWGICAKNHQKSPKFPEIYQCYPESHTKSLKFPETPQFRENNGPKPKNNRKQTFTKLSQNDGLSDGIFAKSSLDLDQISPKFTRNHPKSFPNEWNCWKPLKTDEKNVKNSIRFERPNK